MASDERVLLKTLRGDIVTDVTVKYNRDRKILGVSQGVEHVTLDDVQIKEVLNFVSTRHNQPYKQQIHHLNLVPILNQRHKRLQQKRDSLKQISFILRLTLYQMR